ncbi:FKBP-type peptidyl-prolyl cis-trans isomerase [Micromonospora cathayae]|uniref:Peptidyl-prolyl cis-trans isomerase n=1 Tax=Micromonospora cathayae TaxID=3028804 RepID=A0ABY7ZTQ7_9ACTN|nr:FKBP-type peptidyl-prolyl cis-trans isomerase [Micromonospora sp. HUAS 3]WDZ86434.1 FKBP-type peptidyl-prolyl cis-trans isomerase [Micromonospora sp. HUAS 3]
MSERAESRSTGQSTASKSERRLAAKLAAQKAAEAKRRRQSMLGALAGLAVVAVIVAAFLVFGGNDDEPVGETASAPSAGATSGAPDAPDAPAPGAPQLPEGADPALGTKPTVTKGEGDLTKLTVTPLIKGTGPATKAGQQITVNYVGVFYKTGEEFDASWKTGQPFTFQVGAGQVIPGWDQGLVGVNVGSRVQLDLPADLAYGENAAGGRPAGPLRFVVDVLAAQ